MKVEYKVTMSRDEISDAIAEYLSNQHSLNFDEIKELRFLFNPKKTDVIGVVVVELFKMNEDNL